MDPALTAAIAAIVSIATVIVLFLGHRLLVRKHELEADTARRALWRDIGPFHVATVDMLDAAREARLTLRDHKIETFIAKSQAWHKLMRDRYGLMGPEGMQLSNAIASALDKTQITLAMVRRAPKDRPNGGAEHLRPTCADLWYIRDAVAKDGEIFSR